MTSPERFNEVMEIVDRVYHAPREDRVALLAELCHGNAELRREVQTLLDHDANDCEAVVAAERGDGADIFAAKLMEDAAPEDGPATQPLPERIGQFRIQRVIGQGGMGTVYEAQQENPRRHVALKVIRGGPMRGQLIKRFQREAHVLGLLQHPGIAQVYEAGFAQDGNGKQPYFAMEFVDGLALDEFVHQRNLCTRARMEIIARTCDAVHYAHEKGIIHRDLKPANILVVTGEDGSTGEPLVASLHCGTSPPCGADGPCTGQPKVLDFGVARITDADVQMVTLQTEVGQLVGTLAYMSPEQVVGKPGELDRRSDTYALGVILHELLAGTLPHDIRAYTIPQAVSIIRDEEPSRLGSINSTYRGDIETIVSKAMEKDPARRYQTAAEMAADIRRFLLDEPIQARPASTFYQLGKFTRRNKALVGGLAATFLALILGLAGTGIGLHEAREQRDDAIRARDEAKLAQERLEVVVDFQTLQISSISPRSVGLDMIEDLREESTRGLDQEGLTEDDRQSALDSLEKVLARVNATNLAREIVSGVYGSRARKKLDDGFTDDPIVEADLRVSLGSLYYSLGLYEESLVQRSKALELRRRHLGHKHVDTLSTVSVTGAVLQAMGKLAEAEGYLREALAGRREILGDEHARTLRSLVGLAKLLARQGKAEEAGSYFRQVLEDRRRLLGEDHPDTINSMNELAVHLLNQGQTDEALSWLNRVLETRQHTLGADHHRTIHTRNNVMAVLFKASRLEEAEAIAREVLASYIRVQGDAHPDTIMGRNNLGMVIFRRGRASQAESLFHQAYERSRQHLPAANEIRMKSTSNLVDALLELDRPKKAEPYCRELLAVRRELDRPMPALVARSLEQLGLCRFEQGSFADAEVAFRECLDIREGISVDHWQTGRTGSLLGASLAALERFDEAEPLLVNAHDVLNGAKDDIPSWRRNEELSAARRRTVELYEAWDKPDQATEWRADSE